MLKCGGITLCVFWVTFLCLFININCKGSRKESRAVHKKMEIRLNGFQNELINALVEIEDIRESRAVCTCPLLNTTATGQPDETKASRKEEIDSQTLRNYVERVTKGFDDEKKARKVFQKHLMNLVQDYIKSEDKIWSTWTPWGECSVSCNGGIRKRTRTCDGTDQGMHQGSCLGNNVDIGGCNNKACVDKIWSTWSPWGDCSVTCNGGMRTRTRTCDGTDQGEPQGSCSGNNVDITGCNNKACVGNTWSTWSNWGSCSVTCNGGMRSRTRTCDAADQDESQGSCSGNNVDITGCNNKACVVPMVYFTMSRPNNQLVSEKATFDNTVANVGGGYNTHTGEFVCPVAGLYHFYFSLIQKGTVPAWCYIKHNERYLTQAYTDSDGTYDATSTSAYVKLAVGDIISISRCENWKLVYKHSNGGLFTGALIHL